MNTSRRASALARCRSRRSVRGPAAPGLPLAGYVHMVGSGRRRRRRRDAGWADRGTTGEHGAQVAGGRCAPGEVVSGLGVCSPVPTGHAASAGSSSVTARAPQDISAVTYQDPPAAATREAGGGRTSGVTASPDPVSDALGGGGRWAVGRACLGEAAVRGRGDAVTGQARQRRERAEAEVAFARREAAGKHGPAPCRAASLQEHVAGRERSHTAPAREAARLGTTGRPAEAGTGHVAGSAQQRPRPDRRALAPWRVREPAPTGGVVQGAS